MAITYEDLDDHLRRIALTGRLDIPGTQAVSMQFTTLTATAARRVVVDLDQVDFLASIGIRELVSVAKALKQRGGKMVLLVAPNAAVRGTLETTGIPMLIPTFPSFEEARREALA